MRRAVVVALGDPRSSDAGTWVDAAVWLRQVLVERGFAVTLVDGDDVEGEVARALAEASPGDEVLLHVSGRLAERAVVRTASGRRVRLESLGRALATVQRQEGADTVVLAELWHDDDPADDLAAAEHVSWMLDAFEARANGHAMIAAVRPSGAALEGLAFTRLVLAHPWGEAPDEDARWSTAYQRATGNPQAREAAQSVGFVPGKAERDTVPSIETALPATAPADGPADVEEATPLTPWAIGADSMETSIQGATAERRWLRVVALRRERAAVLGDARLRARELVAVARVLDAELDDAAGAVAALEEARAIDPLRATVLEALHRGYERLGRWEDAYRVLQALGDVAAGPVERAEIRCAQARIAFDRWSDAELAFDLVAAALRDAPPHERALAMLDEIGTARAPVASDREAPPARKDGDIDPEPHERAFSAHWREGRTDAAWLAALALEELGTADPDQQILVDQFRTISPIRARGALDDDAWRQIYPAGSRGAVAALFAAVSRAAVAARLAQLAQQKKLVALDRNTRLDESSTAVVVRSFQWAARVLGVDCPGLYVFDHVPGDLAAVRAHEPSTAVGAGVLRGRTAKELAFFAGRHLTYYRPEHVVLVHFPTGEDLRVLLAATRAIAEDRGGDDDPNVADLRARLDAHLDVRERAAVVAAAHLGAEWPRPDAIAAWARGVELTACRAGLFLCGDLATACAAVRAESRAIAGVTGEERRRDLVAFCSSPEHAELRARFAVTAPESVRPTAQAAEVHSP